MVLSIRYTINYSPDLLNDKLIDGQSCLEERRLYSATVGAVSISYSRKGSKSAVFIIRFVGETEPYLFRKSVSFRDWKIKNIR